jgi:hypothetical protein
MMHSGPRGAVCLAKLALVAWIGLWSAAAPVPASAGADAGDFAQVAEDDTPPPQADPFDEEIAPPPAQEDDEEDQGQVDEGCLFMDRPLELIV